MSIPPGKTRRALTLLVGLALATSALAPAMAARLPDLKVIRITGVDAVEQRGEPFQARVTIRNAGRATAGKSQAVAYLSDDSARSRSDKKLGKAAVGRLAKGKSVSASIRATVPQDTEPSDYYLIVCADATTSIRESSERNNCSSQPMGVEMGPPTSELLDDAVARGEIDEETALLYEVFGAFGDSRFPSKYRGDDEAEFDAHGLTEAALTFDSLSLETQEALIPFLQPPVYPGTWEDLPTAAEPDETRRSSRQTETPPYLPAIFGDEGWFYFEHNRARIWFRDEPIQRDAAQTVYENLDEIWNDLTGLMDRPPLSDAGPHVLETKDGQKIPWGDGGNGKLDIYMEGPDDLRYMHAAAIPYGPCCPRPSFIIMNPWHYKGTGSWLGVTHEKATASIAAHEFMHVLQFTYNRDVPGGEPEHPYFLMNEGVADWAINYVFPDHNLEHVHLDLLNGWGGSFGRGSLWWQGYDSWPFFLYLEKELGAQIIPSIYKKSDEQQEKEIWEAVESAVAKWDERFLEFAGYLLNDVPENTWFELWDGILAHHNLFHEHRFHRISLDGKIENELSLVDPTSKLFRVEPTLQSLDSHHVSYRFDDHKITKIVIENKNAGQPGAHLGAYLKLADGNWQPLDDWSDESTITLCRELASENVTEMVLVFGNSRTGHLHDTIDLSQSKLKVTTKGGCVRWTGTVTGTATNPNGSHVEWTATGSFGDRENFGELAAYTFLGGSLTVRGTVYSGYDDPETGDTRCTNVVDATVSVPPGNGYIDIYQGTYEGSGGYSEDFPLQNSGAWNCEDRWGLPHGWWDTDPEEPMSSEDRLTGTYTTKAGSWTVTYEWDLARG